MASRRQKQFDRKYSSYRKFTATEDVNYSTHSSRSSYRSESVTSRSDGRGRSTSSEIIAGSETRSYPVYIAIQDYHPDSSEDNEAIPLEQGQIVEVLDKKNSVRWLVRTKARPPRCGWVPSSYFETPTEFYKQRRRTRELDDSSLTDEQSAIIKRDQVYLELLRSEEEFVSSLRTCVDDYLKPMDDESTPATVRSHREQIAMNIGEIYNFHANVMLKGLNYYSDDPAKVGQTFVRLEKDFETTHVEFYKRYQAVLKLIEQDKEIRDFFQSLSDKNDASASSFSDHVHEIANRMTQYQNYFKEFVKYATRSPGVSSKSIQKALELVTTIPQRVQDLEIIKNIREYPGDTNKLGRIIRHETFKVFEGDQEPQTRHVFLFPNKLMFTEKTADGNYKHYSTIRLDKYTIRQHTSDEDTIVLQPQEPGLPSFRMKTADLEAAEFARKAWLRDIGDEQERIAALNEAATTNTASSVSGATFDMVSDARSEFSEWSSSRKSSMIPGPDEGGTPRKKIKSPPVISPTGSSASIYSGGSSSIDWTTTGTTLEMQGTRVTRTQYGFRTLQESSAKMCLKVTGYPLPDITWYKDDVQLHEDGRHTFYSDDDGFFAMTIDPVHVTDTGRYTCMATNEYGQASTSAFFRVMKVEKEAAPPAFVTTLKDRECKEGDVINFECEVEGWPEPELQWLIDDQPLRPSQDFRLQYDGQTARLEIRDAQPDDTGVYTVKIQNEFGATESKAELFVEPDPDKNHVAPEFQATIEDVTCAEGDECRFKSVITGDPNPEIVWMINGVPLSESDKVRFVSEDGICILTIRDVTRHFDGIVTCQGANRLGSAECEARLTVKVPPAPPAFNKPLEDKSVQEHASASFDVDVTGWPEPKLEFVLAGKVLQAGVDGVQIVGHDGLYKVTIPDCKEDAEIIARASNEHGTAESRARLIVEPLEEESRSAPTFIKDIEDQTVKLGEWATFETSVRGHPKPDVVWFINGHQMDPTSQGVKMDAHNHDHKLTVDSAQYAGTVLCRAENSVGRFETKARLVVQAPVKARKPPTFLEALRDGEQVHGGAITFEVRVDGEPKPSVEWRLNGEQLTADRIDVREFDGSIKITIKELRLEDDGELKAIATNEEGRTECAARLRVTPKPSAPEFDRKPHTVTIEKGETASFEAHATGYPLPDYQWSINGRKVRESQEGAATSIVDGVSMLRIDTSTYFHESSRLTISVLAENPIGVDETAAQLIVEEKKISIVGESTTTAMAEATATTDQTMDQDQAPIEISMEVKMSGTTTRQESTMVVEQKRRVSFAEDQVPDMDQVKDQVLGKKEKSPESPTKKDKSPESDKKKEMSPEEVQPAADPVKDQGSEKEKSPESPKKKEKSPESPKKKEKSPESPKKKEKSPETAKPDVDQVKDQGSEKEKSPESPKKKEKSPESPKKKEKSPEEAKPDVDQVKDQGSEKEKSPESPKKKEKSPESPKKEEKSPESPKKKEKSPEAAKADVDQVKDQGSEKEKSPESPKKKEKSPESPKKKENSPEEAKPDADQAKDQGPEKEKSPESPKKKEKSPESPKKKENSPEEAKPDADQAKDQGLEKEKSPDSPKKKEKSPESPKKKEKNPEEAKPDADQAKDQGPEKEKSPDSPKKKEKSPESPKKKEKSPESPKKKETSPEDSKKSGSDQKNSPEPAKPEIAAPTIIRDLTSQTVTKGHLAHFEIVAERATSCRWTVNGRQLDESMAGVKLSHDDAFEFRLSLDTQLFAEDVSRIEVKAENEGGHAETRCELRVEQPAKVVKKPEFTDKLVAMEVIEGETLKVDVIALNNPQFKWFLNGREISDGIETSGNKSTLTITGSESGTLRVEASNEAGSVDSEAALRVVPKSTAPQFREGPKPTDDGGEYFVHVDGFPEVRIKWQLDENSLQAVREEAGKSWVKIADDAAGVLTATASNSAGTATQSLRIEKKATKPVFKQNLVEKIADEGEPMRWNIEVEGGDCEVEWYLNGTRLEPSENCHFGTGEVKTLTIAQASPDMNGVLKVVARNSCGEAESEAKVKVNRRQAGPEFVQKPQDHETFVDESVKFSAIVTGSPMPSVAWFLNDKKLVQSEQVKVKYVHETGKTSIRIHKPREGGRVRVEAENALGKIEATASLKVETRPEVPKFETNMDDRQVNEGENVKYTTRVDGFPEPDVQWTLDGKDVQQMANVQLHKDGKEHTMVIEKIQPEQSGELSCIATNAVGSKRRDVQLMVKKTGIAPGFEKELDDRMVQEGELLVMEAVLKECKPEASLEWFKDGEKLVLDERKKQIIEGRAVQLRITESLMEDKGRIVLKASNEFGEAETSASLGVLKGRPMNKPAFQSKLGPIELKEGDTLDCKLLITGDPTPFVKWYINGQLVALTEDTEITNANGVYNLKIHGVSTDMTGKIKCVAYNKAGEVSTEGSLTVVAPIPVEFETSLCDATCREGDTLKLKAVLLGEPTPDVSWYVNGKKLAESQNIKIHAEKGTYTVTIKDISCDYSGQVVCEAVNEYGRATSEATLLVLPRGEPPDFIEWLSNVRARKESKVVHKVVFTGDPQPTLTWFINNQEVLNGEQYSVVTTGNTSTLTIHSFNPDVHVGEIICKAENDAGEVSCTANMLTYTSDMFSESESEAQEFAADDITEDESMREEMHRTPTPVMAPKFITKVKDTRAKRGHSAVFECVVPDTKGVCCKWLKDGKEIELIARIRVQTRTGPEGHVTQELILDDVKPEDAGKYTCIVENSSGRDVCEATLTVVESLEKKSTQPEFVEALRDTQVRVNEQLTVQCKVVGEPTPTVKWLFENKEVSSECIIESVNGIEKLTIKSSEMKHEGKYTCVAENSVGKSKTEAFVKVEGSAPEFTKKLDERKEVRIGEKLVLSCSVRGTPQPHVEFYQNGVKMQSSSRYAIEHDASCTHWRLVVSRVELTDVTSYRALAVNQVASAECHSEVVRKLAEPVIEQGLKKTSVKENEEIRMEVKVSGDEPRVTFLKDGEPVANDTNHEIVKNAETGAFCLVVKSASMADAGRYTAQVENPAGKAESHAEAEVSRELVAPTFVRELAKTEVRVNESATMSITVKGNPEPSVDWIKDGVRVEMVEKIVKEEQGMTHSIEIKSAKLEDAGVYGCKARNEAGEAHTEAELVIARQSIAPEFTQKLRPLEVSETQKVTLEVKVVGEPAPNVQWLKDGNPVNVDGTHVICKQSQDGSHSLLIDSARQEDVGVYTCVATNIAGEAKTTANMAMQEEIEAPFFAQGLKEMEVSQDEKIVLKVKVEGKPEPLVEWFKDGKKLEIDGQHVMERKGDKGEYEITIDKAQKLDGGVYGCKATNKAGKDETLAEVKFPKYSFEKVTPEECAPMIIEELRESVCRVGEEIRMECRVNVSEAKPDIRFYKDGSEVKADERTKIEVKEDGLVRLEIRNATSQDVGNYKCEATNRVGAAQTKADLKFAQETAQKVEMEQLGQMEDMHAPQQANCPPEFVELLRSCTATIGSTARLTCKVRGQPTPTIKWTKNGAEVKATERIKMVHADDGTVELIIDELKQEDIGEYQCKAENEQGSAWTEAPIIVGSSAEVRCDGEAPDFIQPVRPAIVKVGETAVLEGKISGKPRPTVKWYKNGKELSGDERVRMEDNDDGTQRLIIANARKDDQDEYRCSASNDYGDVWSDVTLTVNTPAPRIVKELTAVTAVEKETATMECVVGNREDDVKWFKDGAQLVPDERHKLEELDDGRRRLIIDTVRLEDQANYRVEVSNECGSASSKAPLTVKPLDELKLKTPLDDVSTTERTRIHLQVEVIGKPKTVRWYRQDAEIATDARVKYERVSDEQHRLIIEEARVEDAGKYRVVLSTESHQSVESTCQVTVTHKLPTFKKGLKDETIKKGDKLQLQVEIEGTAKTVKWYKDGKELEECRGKTTVQVEDGGVYAVVAANDAGEVESKAEVKVKPQIVSGLVSMNVKQGETATFKVKVDGPVKKVKWYKNGKEIPEEKTKDLGDGEYVLEIPDAQEDDAADYKVVVSNDAGDADSNAALTVKLEEPQDDGKDKEKPKIVSGLVPTSVKQGETATFKVKVQGPVKKVKWYKNGKEIPEEKTKDLGDGEYQLQIPDAQEDDAADYKVVLSNDAGDADSSAALTVKLPEKPSDDDKDKEKPKIVSGLVPTTVKQGETATFKVKVQGPVKKVKWYKNGKEIEQPKTKELGDGEYALEIPDAQEDDAADYKVVLSNDAGDADSSAALTVKLPEKPTDDGKDKEKPKIVSGLVPTTVKQGETATFKVKVQGPVKKVKWYKNGKEIPDAKAKDLGDGEYALEIPDAQEDDAADYKVVLSNDAGDADSSAALTVKLPEKPTDDGKDKEKPKIVSGLVPTSVKKGDTATFKVKVQGPVKKVKWYKNGKEIPDAKAKDLGDGEYALEVPDAQEDDAADYQVVLSNDAGDADSSAALTVKLPEKPTDDGKDKEKPKIISGLVPTTVKKGDTATFKVKVQGPVKKVKWYKNGKELASPQASDLGDGEYQLQIPDAQEDDAADYKVVLSNDAGDADSSAALTVKLPPIEIVKPLQDATIPEGSRDALEVTASRPPKTVKWYKNGVELKQNGKVDGKTARMVIPSASLEDDGEYRVVLEDEDGHTAESSCKLTVKLAPKKPRIVKGLEDCVVAKGATMVFEVTVEGVVDKVRWFKNGVEMKDGVSEKVDENTYRLRIDNAQEDGDFEVVVSNEAGKASSQAKGEVDEVPSVLKGLQDVDVIEGDEILMKLETNRKIRQVKWYKNGVELKTDERLSLKNGTKKFEMIISRSVLEDAADYKIVVSNAGGACESTASAVVRKKESFKIVEGLKDLEMLVGDSGELAVLVEGTPVSAKWYKNGTEIAGDSTIEGGRCVLKLKDCKKDDGGAYRVVLRNANGQEIYSDGMVIVRTPKVDKKEPAVFVTGLEDQRVPIGEMLTLQCKISGDIDDVQWFKDGKQLVKDDRVTIRLALDGTATLRVRGARLDDIGAYECVVNAGETRSACKVQVVEETEAAGKPVFVIPLSTSASLPGEAKEFKVKVRGADDLEWSINGRAVDAQRMHVEDMSDGNFVLTIKPVNEDDFGEIKCVARNKHGVSESVCELERARDPRAPGAKDDLRYPPRFNVPLWDRRIPAGDAMFIECHVDANPTATIEWFKESVKIEHSSHYQIRNTVDGACRLSIVPFDENDVGVYECVAVNELGQAETRARYAVEVAEELVVEESKEHAPRIQPGLEDTCVKQGERIVLQCGIVANPEATVCWYKDGLPLKDSSRLKTRFVGGMASLEVSEATEADAGAYRCIASNVHGTINTSCSVGVKTEKVEVRKEGAEPFFTKGLVDAWTDRGDTFCLKCRVTGDPFPEIKWYRNGQLVRNTNRCVISTTQEELTLTVHEASMTDEGVYRCEAENAHGRAKTQCTMHVQMAIGKTETPKIADGTPPRFVIELEDKTVAVKGRIELECKVAGEPTPSLKWSKDGGPLIEDARFRWENEESRGVYRLLIDNATVHEEGTYRCVATNEYGTASSKSFVRIEDALRKPVGKMDEPPRFTIRLGDVRVMEGAPLKMSCRVEATPTPQLVWYKDGVVVEPSERVQLSLAADGTAELFIAAATADDDGLYRVIAKNDAGTAQDKGTATVKKLARERQPLVAGDGFETNKAPKLIEPLENVRVPEKQGFRLRCKFAGEKLNIKWFKDGDRVFPYGRLELIEEGGVCELVVASSSRHDAGSYRCIAENAYGTARTSCDVSIIRGDRKPRDIPTTFAAPGFTIPLTVKRCKLGELVTLECLPYGDPFPEIKWLKDGLDIAASASVQIDKLDNGTQRLTISAAQFDHEGNYRCVATNVHGTASTKAELIVEGDRRISKPVEPIEEQSAKPRIRRGLYNMSIHQGNVVEMIVCATGVPTPTVKWFKDGVELTPDEKRVVFTDERGIHHLVIVNASPEDEGEYSLEATNAHGSAKTSGELNIIRPRISADGVDGGLYPPGFVRQLKNKHVFNHMPTIFDCLVVGHPTPDVEWFHNGKKVQPSHRVKIQTCGGGSHALIIMDTTMDDSGEYVAVAKNSQGSASSSAVLDVTVPFLDHIKFTGEIDVTPYLTEEYGFKKINTASLPTPPDRGPFIKEVTGHYLTLSWIPTKRAPPRYPQVTYCIEIRELPEKEWTLLDYNIPEPVCKVRNLELGKSYQFRVRAENIYGISDPSPASPPSRLMAPPQPVFDRRTNKIIPLLDPYAERALDQRYAEQYACAPWFAPGVVEKRYCALNETLTLSLNVSGYPDPTISWKFRGWDVDTKSATSRFKVYTYGGNETTLVINSFGKDDAGQYQCVATNEYGEAVQKILVDVSERPTFIQSLENRTFSQTQPVKLTVRVDGQPFPEIKWMKEWRPIVESSRIKFEQDGPYMCSLIINDPMWRDSGIYSCVAVNEAGQATTSCTVTVEDEGLYLDSAAHQPRRRVTIESRRVRDLYEISESQEKLAAFGSPFHVVDKSTREQLLAQLRPIDESLQRHVDMHNSLTEHPGMARMRRAVRDEQLALIVFDSPELSTLQHPGTSLGSAQSRETCVRVFVRQLLLALKHMHDMRIAHLDLRPETILLQDDKLKLADFGQSRRLLRGLITGEIKGSPEFVSPEIVRSLPLTLATDMWSCGVLVYVLLSGLSPFHGDNDAETLMNVDRCRYDESPLGEFSHDALDFIRKLIVEVPAYRLTVDEALSHPWINDKSIETARLSADTLREFKYQHKWLERRVFVQQTPSEQIIEAILGPRTQLPDVNERHQQPETARKRAPPEHAPFVDEFGRVIDPRSFEESRMEPPKRKLVPQEKGETPSKPKTTAPVVAAPVPVRMIRGERRDIEEEIANRILSDISEEGSIAGSLASLEDIEIDYFPSRESTPTPEDEKTVKERVPMQEKVTVEQTPRAIKPKDQTEVPSNNDVKEGIPMKEKIPIEQVPILNQKSEEMSRNEVIVPVQAMKEMPSENIPGKNIPEKQADQNQPDPASRRTPIIRKSPCDDIPDIPDIPLDPPAYSHLLDDAEKKVLEAAEQNPNIPVGAPLFLEGLHDPEHVETTSASGFIKVISPGAALSPSQTSPRRCKPGTKSPVILSPRQEHSMEVLIATKRGKPGFLPPDEQAPEIDDDDAFMDKKKTRAAEKKHQDDDGFDDQKEKLKKREKLFDLDKYRPSNFFPDREAGTEEDIDYSPWDSHYQIGPDTYLMAARGAEFNSRVRNYRQELFGPGAPLVRQGFLGVRNRDITVRQRRRYTDILRESQGLQEKASNGSTPSTAVERIRADIDKVPACATKKNDDGTFAPIFTQRLRDVYLREKKAAVFECKIMSNPKADVQWQFQGRVIETTGRYRLEDDGQRLLIESAQPYDLGEYVCTATNQFGVDKSSCRLISGDTPPRPGRPECALSSDTEMFIQWEPPECTTYLEGITYRLEYRHAGANDHGAPWICISERIDDECVVVKHLQAMGVYQFRVTARNGFGLGVPSLSSRIVQTHAKGQQKLQIDVLRERIRLNVVSMPQQSKNQLGGISEESDMDAAAIDVVHTEDGVKNEDPKKRFEIGGLKFRGAFAIIRDAIDSSTEAGAHCAVKIRKNEDDAQQELNNLKNAQHENIVKLLAAYQYEDFLFTFTERLYEDVFSRFVFNDYYTEEQVALTMRQVISGMHYLHFKGIVHMDINPHNIMFQSKRNWIVKIVDLGSAVPQSSKKSQLKNKVDCKWSAPETLVQDDINVTMQCDMWSMGCVTFCLLAGFHPFTSEFVDGGDEEIINNVLNVKCDPNLIPVNASQESLSFVTWSLKKSPVRRMRTDEALNHRFLSTDPSMVRRRDSIKYSSSRLRKLAAMIRQPIDVQPLCQQLDDKYGKSM